jgi:hypothetical protein
MKAFCRRLGLIPYGGHFLAGEWFRSEAGSREVVFG